MPRSKRNEYIAEPNPGAFDVVDEISFSFDESTREHLKSAIDGVRYEGPGQKLERTVGSDRDEEPESATKEKTNLIDALAFFELDQIDVRDSHPALTLVGTSDYCRDRFKLTPGKVTVGRTDENTIIINHVGVSRRHAVFDVAESIHVSDLGSQNGTYVNGLRLKPQERAVVQSGDVVCFGKARFLVGQENAEPSRVTTMPKQKPARPEPEKRPTTAKDRKPPPPEAVERPQKVSEPPPVPAEPSVVTNLTNKVQQLEWERKQLVILFQLALRYISQREQKSPIKILFEVLDRLVVFDAAFVAMPKADGTISFFPHPGGERFSARACAHVVMDLDPKAPLVFDGPHDVLELEQFTVASRAIVPLHNGGCLCLLSKESGLYAAQIDFLALLGKLHSTAAA